MVMPRSESVDSLAAALRRVPNRYPASAATRNAAMVPARMAHSGNDPRNPCIAIPPSERRRDGPCGRRRIAALAERPADDHHVGARRHRLGRRGHPGLVAPGGPGRADARYHQQGTGTDGGPDGRHLVRRADQAVGPRAHREARQPDHGLGRRPDEPDASERRVVEAGEHRDGEDVQLPPAPRTAARTISSPPAACTVSREAPLAAALRAAPSTVLGMSCSLRSRKTGRPSDAAARTAGGPSAVKSSSPTLSMPTSGATARANGSASRQVGRSMAAQMRSRPGRLMVPPLACAPPRRGRAPPRREAGSCPPRRARRSGTTPAPRGPARARPGPVAGNPPPR